MDPRKPAPDGPHLMLFDLYAGGHHGHHIEQMVKYWTRHAPPGRLSVVVPGSFLEKHPALPVLVEAADTERIALVPIRERVRIDPPGPFRLLRNDREHGRMLRRYVRMLRPDHCLLMYFDHVQLSLAFDLRFGFPVRFSGIYFRPTFHYHTLGGAAPDPKEKVRGFRKKVVLAAALRNPHFLNLFCFDPFVVPHVRQLAPKARAVALPDGIERTPPVRSPEAVRATLEVEPGRKVALMFGVLDERKGVLALLDALAHVPESAAARLCVVLAGAVAEREAAQVYASIQRLRETTRLQIVLRDAFVPEEEIQDLFRASDLALLPYVRHVGSSGVLVRAAAEGKPVVGSDYGILGEHIRRRRLGLAVDTTDPKALADALVLALTRPDALPFDAGEAERFARENTIGRFLETLLGHMDVPTAPRTTDRDATGAAGTTLLP